LKSKQLGKSAMKLGNLLVLALGAVLSTVAFAQSREVVNPSEVRVTTYVPGAPTQVLGGSTLLDTRAGLVNSPGTGAGGADESLLQDSSLAMSTFGFAVASTSTYRIADDFTVPVSGWDISDITVYTYQTGSTTTSTITGLTLQIWDGDPSLGTSSVVFGDTSTNVLSSSAFSNIYRGLESAPGTTNRPIMAATASGLSISLPAGTYWLDFQIAGSLGSGPWAPPLTTTGQTATGNALQFDGSVWAAATDVGQQGFPMTIGGAGGGVPFTPPRELPINSSWLLLALLGGLLSFGALALIRR
jgi:hypothetical protein